MLDMTEQIISMLRTIDDFNGNVTTIYPMKVQSTAPFAVLQPISHDPYLIQDGEEVIADLGYTLDIFASSPGKCRELMERASALFIPLYIRVTGQTLSVEPTYQMYDTSVSLNVRVDKRGITYTS